MTARQLTLVEIEAYDPALPGVRTLYYSTGRFVTGAADTPAHVAFQPRIITAPSFARRAFGSLRVAGGGQASVGLLELNNADHALAPLLDYGMDGRDITIRVGPEGGAYPADFTTWLLGTIEQPEVGASKVTLRIRDRQALLDQPAQPTLYAGTNSLPSGAEGVEGDIKGKPKPLCFGRCLHVSPVLVNTAKLIYQVHDGATQAISAVYDQAVALTPSGSDRADLAALEAATIAAGEYDTCLALGLFRLGSSAAGRITADVQGDNDATYVDRTGAILRRLLEGRAGVATADLDTASFTALDAAVNYEVGIYIAESVPYRAAVDRLCASVGAWLVPTRQGLWQVGRLVAPSGSPDYTVTDKQIIDIDRIATNDAGRGVPVWRVELRYAPYWTMFAPADIAGGVTEATRAALLQTTRTVVAEDAAVQTKHLLATTLERDTLLLSAANAATEAARLLAMHKVRRDLTRLRLPLTAAFSAIDLGEEVTPTTPALGYGAGRDLVVVGVTMEGQVIEQDLWG